MSKHICFKCCTPTYCESHLTMKDPKRQQLKIEDVEHPGRNSARVSRADGKAPPKFGHSNTCQVVSHQCLLHANSSIRRETRQNAIGTVLTTSRDHSAFNGLFSRQEALQAGLGSCRHMQELFLLLASNHWAFGSCFISDCFGHIADVNRVARCPWRESGKAASNHGSYHV